MFDNLRNQPGEEHFKEEEPAPEVEETKPRKVRVRSPGRGLGMTAPQRFVLTLMLFVTVFLMGFMLLVFTGKIVPLF